MPQPTIVIKHGAPTTSANLPRPGLRAGRRDHDRLRPETSLTRSRSPSNSNKDVAKESFTTDANGAGEHDQLDYDVPNETVWIVVAGGVVQTRLGGPDECDGRVGVYQRIADNVATRGAR